MFCNFSTFFFRLFYCSHTQCAVIIFHIFCFIRNFAYTILFFILCDFFSKASQKIKKKIKRFQWLQRQRTQQFFDIITTKCVYIYILIKANFIYFFVNLHNFITYSKYVEIKSQQKACLLLRRVVSEWEKKTSLSWRNKMNG